MSTSVSAGRSTGCSGMNTRQSKRAFTVIMGTSFPLILAESPRRQEGDDKTACQSCSVPTQADCRQPSLNLRNIADIDRAVDVAPGEACSGGVELPLRA